MLYFDYCRIIRWLSSFNVADHILKKLLLTSRFSSIFVLCFRCHDLFHFFFFQMYHGSSTPNPYGGLPVRPHENIPFVKVRYCCTKRGLKTSCRVKAIPSFGRVFSCRKFTTGNEMTMSWRRKLAACVSKVGCHQSAWSSDFHVTRSSGSEPHGA